MNLSLTAKPYCLALREIHHVRFDSFIQSLLVDA